MNQSQLTSFLTPDGFMRNQDPKQAVIFDLDGTLVDNMDFHAESFQAFLAAHGLPRLDDHMRHQIDGKRNRDIFPILFGKELDADTLRQYSVEKETHYRNLSRGRLQPIKGLIEFLNLLENKNIPFGIATSAPELNVEHSLKEIGLTERFDVIVRSDQVSRGKPFPDVFLTAAQKLNCDPKLCLAFEDAPAGIQSAIAAGMDCVAITTSFSAVDIRKTCAPVLDCKDYQEVMEAWPQLGLGA